MAQKVVIKILIVNDGEWGLLRQAYGNYEAFVETIKDAIERSAKKDERTEEVFEVEVVKSLEEAMAVCENYHIKCIFFVSRGILARARQALKMFERTAQRLPRMVLLTGLIPEDEVILIRKQWVTGDLLHSLAID